MWAGIWKKLFANNGAGPLLRQDILPDIPEALLPPLPVAGAATEQTAGSPGLISLAAGNDTTSWNRAASAAGVAAQLAALSNLNGLTVQTFSRSQSWTPPRLGGCLVLLYGGGGGAGGCARVTSSGTNRGTSSGGAGGAGGSMFFLQEITSLDPWAITVGEGGGGGTSGSTTDGKTSGTGGAGGGASFVTIPSVGAYGVGGGGGGGGASRSWKDASAVWHGGEGRPGGITAEPGENGGSPSSSYAEGGGIITLSAGAFADRTRPLFHIGGKDFGRGAPRTADYAIKPQPGQTGAVIIIC